MTAKPEPPPATGSFVLTPGQRAQLLNGPTLSIEDVVAAPGAKRATFTLVVEVEGYQKPSRLAMDLDAGRSVWSADGFRITVDRADELPRLVFHAERVLSDEVRAELVTTQRVARGGKISLAKDLEMVFRGHGHKTVMPGDSSPLMVTVAFLGPGLPAEDTYYNAGGESSAPPQFSWRDYRFTVTKYAYDEFMELRIERLAFESVPISAPASTPGR